MMLLFIKCEVLRLTIHFEDLEVDNAFMFILIIYSVKIIKNLILI